MHFSFLRSVFENFDWNIENHKGNKTYVTFSKIIFPLNWCKLKFFREVKMKKTLVTFPFNERTYVTV